MLELLTALLYSQQERIHQYSLLPNMHPSQSAMLQHKTTQTHMFLSPHL